MKENKSFSKRTCYGYAAIFLLICFVLPVMGEAKQALAVDGTKAAALSPPLRIIELYAPPSHLWVKSLAKRLKLWEEREQIRNLQGEQK